mmetsp:Transcript_8756/g.22058  ORF Transcript_8756/g.22058 Transcript_8756/m.22058 type:complete len:148 (-) Transcript_8756:136-579(-)|eukprot:CAMPEP_0177647300 /NCGR_PEP_ID=MMETSP0447-20121125/10226_1 /TAXON_ID=0 /ORGANISM="Stygamoeba regulata, Strain BSH-02190019" /LENGTH=147 /DNA_ID=CAMNT_0019149875 /DNA_START=123 /DNA_END=566 /DNA_ORIENTATION=+
MASKTEEIPPKAEEEKKEEEEEEEEVEEEEEEDDEPIPTAEEALKIIASAIGKDDTISDAERTQLSRCTRTVIPWFMGFQMGDDAIASLIKAVNEHTGSTATLVSNDDEWGDHMRVRGPHEKLIVKTKSGAVRYRLICDGDPYVHDA